MDLAKKQFISLKLLTMRVKTILKRMRRLSEELSRISQESDVTPQEILKLLEQMTGKREITFDQKKCLEIGWLVVKAILRDSFLNEGLACVIDGADEVAEEIGVSSVEMRECYADIISEITHDLFLPKQT